MADSSFDINANMHFLQVGIFHFQPLDLHFKLLPRFATTIKETDADAKAEFN